MWKQFHTLCLDNAFLIAASRTIQCIASSDIISHTFIQSFIHKLLTFILNVTTSYIEKENCITECSMSFNDQSVLFYIAGFIVHALSMKGDLYSNIIEKLTSTDHKETYLQIFKSWSEKIDRGDLRLHQMTFTYS
ncbi:hypothetical protein SNE40_001606 [Patella caerulea]|uniref:Uncharacterized protein n=1 Tax=Patella caerulea TaxID=87958 RepID=A0AAN8KEW7_PATCE